MKKNLPFLIFSLVLALFFILTGSFTIFSTVSPKSYWLSTVLLSTDGAYVQDAYVTVDLDRTSISSDTEEQKIASIWVNIGKIYRTEEAGKITIEFDFKTQSDSNNYYVRKSATIDTSDLDKLYNWVEVWNAETSGENGIAYSRCKVHTSDIIEFYEVVFVNNKGKMFNITNGVVDESSFGSGENASAAAITDEQNTFTTSKSRMYHLTDDEVSEVLAVQSYFAGDGASVAKSPVGLMINALMISIFGISTFSLRIMSFIFAYVSLLLVYRLCFRLFAKDEVSIFASASVLFFYSLFFAGITASVSLSVLMTIIAVILCLDYITTYADFANKKASVMNLGIAGAVLGMAIALNSLMMFIAIALIVLVVIKTIKCYKQYKLDEKQAVGLQKEEVYLEYHSRFKTMAWAYPLFIVVVPSLLIMLGYAMVAKNYKTYYDAGFIGAMSADMFAKFKMNYAVNPILLLLGFGKETHGNNVMFTNYVMGILSVLSFILVTVAVVAGKGGFLSKVKDRTRNKYLAILPFFIAVMIPLLFGMDSTVLGFAVVSVFLSLYIQMGFLSLSVAVGKKCRNIIRYVVMGICLVMFGMAFVGIAGIEVSEIAAKILYLWQV